MTATRHLFPNLKETVRTVVSDSPDRREVNALVEICRALAEAFLLGKSSNGMLATLHGLRINDLAYDCIAELFRVDDRGNYLELQSYFSGVSINELSDEEVLPHLRRLVFSKVNQGIFRLYSEMDPSLAKILRNVKLAVISMKMFTESERFGEACLAPSLADPLTHLPAFDAAEIEGRFGAVTTGRELIPQLLGKLSLLLREQDEYCRVVPLLRVAMLIRKTYEGKQPAQDESDRADATLHLGDVMAVISESCTEIKRKMRPKYVDTGKVEECVLGFYFDVIETEMMSRADGGHTDQANLFTLLRRYLPGMEKDEYHEHHRGRLEYCLRLVGQRVTAKLQGHT